MFHSRLIYVSLALALLSGCEDPAKDVAKAEVEAPTEGSAPTPSIANGEKLTLSSDTSKLDWVGSKVTCSHEGSFKKFSGSVVLAEGKAEGGAIEVTIDTTSVDSDAAKLTKHLKNPDFFDVEKHPKATFVSTKIVSGGAEGATHTITGNLELNGVKKSISFPSTITITEASVTSTSEFSINRKDFGIVYKGKPDDLIREDVVIKLDIKAPRKK